MKKIITTFAATLGLLILVILSRAFLHQPDSIESINQVEITLDQDILARHLSEAVQFRTVSYQRAEDFDAEQFEGFIHWVQNTYPEFNLAMQLEVLGVHIDQLDKDQLLYLNSYSEGT